MESDLQTIFNLKVVVSYLFRAIIGGQIVWNRFFLKKQTLSDQQIKLLVCVPPITSSSIIFCSILGIHRRMATIFNV